LSALTTAPRFQLHLDRKQRHLIANPGPGSAGDEAGGIIRF